MLQNMVTTITSEGEKEKELFEKFMCYCKGGGAQLDASIDAAETKIPAVDSSIKVAEAQKLQLAADLKSHYSSRDEANAAIASATALRNKEAAAFAKESSDFNTNIAALKKAIAAVSQGMGAGFLQTKTASTVRSLAMYANVQMSDTDREDLLSFLSGKNSDGYAPASGEINGILKQLSDDMVADLATSTNGENAAIASFEELMAAKKKEIGALSQSIEEKTMRVGELGVDIAMMKNDLSDTEETLAEDTKFKAELAKSCKTKEAEWEERSATRTEELVALSETIKILNDDDAMELFKKTLPGA